MNTNGYLFSILLGLHVLAGLVGFGAVAVTWFSLRLLRDPSGYDDAVRYFDGRPIMAEGTILLLPIFGAFLFLQPHGFHDYLHPWFFGGVTLWVVSAGVLTAVLWPQERALGEALKAGRDTSKNTKRIRSGSRALVGIYLLGVYLMLFKPSL